MSYLTPQYDPQSCEDIIEHHREKMQVVCPAEYLEWGYDSPEECVNDQMATFDHRRACNMLNSPSPIYTGKVGESLPPCDTSDPDCWINSIIDN